MILTKTDWGLRFPGYLYTDTILQTYKCWQIVKNLILSVNYIFLNIKGISMEDLDYATCVWK